MLINAWKLGEGEREGGKGGSRELTKSMEVQQDCCVVMHFG